MKSVVWELGSVVYLFVATFIISVSPVWLLLQWLLVVSVFLLVRLEPLRQLISQKSFKIAARSLPKLTKTEEEALNAGDTWLEEDIFRGAPDWERLSVIATELTVEERAFLDNETEQLCGMLDESTHFPNNWIRQKRSGTS